MFLNSQSYSQNNDINLNNKTFSEVIMENYPNLRIDFICPPLSLFLLALKFNPLHSDIQCIFRVKMFL